VTELFNRAVGQLRDPKLEVRLAAIYVLREVARDLYLRAGDIDYGDEQPPIDVQEIVELLRNKLGEP
jgi:hypothetical protein